MEFCEKIKKLRTQSNMTQEQLAQKLYVSRTAVSKWESGKGYPNIDSLKDIATLFSITIDELLSSEEIIILAEKEKVTTIKNISSLMFGLLDVISILLMLLPIYPYQTENFVYSVPLLSANGIGEGIKASFIIIFAILSLVGVAELVLYILCNKKLQTIINVVSIITQSISVLFFAMSRQGYLTSIVFIFLLLKIFLMVQTISSKTHQS